VEVPRPRRERRRFETAEPGDVGVDARLLQHKRVAGGERFDLGEGKGLVADVVDVAVRQVAAGQLGDEGRLSLERLPSPNFASAESVELVGWAD
jgi:hypothetical protein